MKKSEKKIGYAKLYVNLVKYYVKVKIGTIYFKYCKTIKLAK